MLRPIVVIARFTLLEAWRTRLPWIALAVIASGVAIATFAGALALTDSASFVSDLYASWARLALVATCVLFVTASVAREFNERVLDLSLSRPITRGQWYAGRLCGFALCALIMALAAALPLALSGSALAILTWSVLLAAELVLVSAAALTASVALGQATAAALGVAAFYLLSRSIAAMVLMSQGPAVAPAAWTGEVVTRMVEIIALLLPTLDRYADPARLHDLASSLAVLPRLLMECAVYVVLLATVGLFDFARRDV